MLKVKVFRFEVSNSSSAAFSDELSSAWYKSMQKLLASEEMIESTINDFIKNKNIESISVNTIDVNYHNNGRGNTVHLLYTIIYS